MNSVPKRDSSYCRSDGIQERSIQKRDIQSKRHFDEARGELKNKMFIQNVISTIGEISKIYSIPQRDLSLWSR
ncbi:MAG: hypothetical protein LC105_12335 [Chitinophagales bacterium]|nr:hypothetical protein [Chitinophagales bacterium]